MIRPFFLLFAITASLPGCTSTGSNGQPETDYSLLRGAFSGAKWGVWTPEFPPDGTGYGRSHR